MTTSVTHYHQTNPRVESHQTAPPNSSIIIVPDNDLYVIKNILLPLKACILSIKERLCWIFSLLFSFFQKTRTVDESPVNHNHDALNAEIDQHEVHSNENNNRLDQNNENPLSSREIHLPELQSPSERFILETTESQTENEQNIKVNPLVNDTPPTVEEISHRSTIDNKENNGISLLSHERQTAQRPSLSSDIQPEQTVSHEPIVPILNNTLPNQQQCSESENSTIESESDMQETSGPTAIDYKIAAYHQFMVDLDTLYPLLKKSETHRLLTPYSCESIVLNFDRLTALLPNTEIFNNIDDVNNYMNALTQNNESQQDSHTTEFIEAMYNLNKFIKTACRRKARHRTDLSIDKTLSILLPQLATNLDILFSHTIKQEDIPTPDTHPALQHSSPTQRQRTYIKIPIFSRTPPKLTK